MWEKTKEIEQFNCEKDDKFLQSLIYKKLM